LAPSTDQQTGSMWMGRRPGVRTWAAAAEMQRVRSSSLTGRAPSATLAWTRLEESWPPAVATVTPVTLTPAARSARSTAWAMALAASSILMMDAPRTPLEAT
jgi:hypothetical protein